MCNHFFLVPRVMIPFSVFGLYFILFSYYICIAASSGLSYNLPAQMFHTWSGAQVPGVTEYQQVSYQRDENASGKPHNTEKSRFDLACRMIHAMPQQTIQRTSLTELDVCWLIRSSFLVNH